MTEKILDKLSEEPPVKSESPRENSGSGVKLILLFIVFIAAVTPVVLFFSGYFDDDTLKNEVSVIPDSVVETPNANKPGKPVLAPEEKIEAGKTLERLLSNFSFEKEQLSNVGWYNHLNQEDADKQKSLLVHVNDKGFIYLESNWFGADWIFHKKVRLKIGDKMYETSELESYSDDHYTEALSDGVVEKNHFKRKIDEIITAIAKNYDAEIRMWFVGDKATDIIELSDKDKLAIKEAYELSQALKKLR